MSAAERIKALEGLLKSVKRADEADPHLDAQIAVAFDLRPDWASKDNRKLVYTRTKPLGLPLVALGRGGPSVFVPPVSASVDAALALAARILPGWWVTSGLCSLSGHASIGPDYNGPAGERLKAEFPPERFDHGGFDADLKPGDGPHRQCLAIIACLLSAKIAALSILAQEAEREGP